VRHVINRKMKIFDTYIQDIQQHRIDEVTEHTYRKQLQDLLECVADEAGKDLSVLHEPKRESGFGAPDFKIKTKGEAILGYVENKKLSEDLDSILKSDQIKKYQSLSDNILLTNYIEWIWIKDSDVIDRAKLCELSDLENKMSFILDPGKAEKVKTIIINFYSQAPKGIGKPKQLAEALAIRARYLRDFLHIELNRQEKEHQEERLFGLYNTFKSNVFQELTKKEFSDAFSQTLVYGLFLSKLSAGTTIIDLYNAKQHILPAFGLISELVDFLDVLDKPYYKDARWIVEEILSVMNSLDLPSIAKNLSYEKFKTTNLFDEENISYKDPYIYFYEHFLAAYDKKLRKLKGVYYTPPQVVNFIVRSIDNILKNTFGIDNGFANKNRVTVLDFATGTGTFLLEILEIIFEELPNGSGKKNLLIRDHILKNFYGFENMIAPYAVANLKLSQFLKEQGYQLNDDDRFQIYLTNTLEPVDPQLKIPLLPTLTKESKAAQKVKDNPILVITGNPPYAGHSRNPSSKTVTVQNKKGKDVKRKIKTWIGERIDTYRLVDGQPLGERNSKWLQDDYVKFIRFAQWKMDQVEEGIVGIITNHRFISNPTFRGMRQSLMKSFNQIHILDLHGSNKPKEFAPDGTHDDNVFDMIQQGVAISFFVKKPGLKKKIVHADLFGKRVEKYDYCLKEGIESVNWKHINPKPPFYLFEKVDDTLESKYRSFASINDIFQVYGNGIVSKRDKFIIDSDINSLRSRLRIFKDESISDSVVAEKFALPIKDKDKWILSDARKHLQKTGIQDELFQQLYYRPFDHKTIYSDDVLVARLVKTVADNFIHDNIAIVTGRAGQNVGGSEWNLAFCSRKMTDLNLFYRGGAKTYPLFLYSDANEKPGDIQMETFNHKEQSTKTANYQKDFDSSVKTLYGRCNPEDVFGYIYAILYSHTYRNKYESFLKIDFPRIPLTKDKKIFRALSKLGWEIINAHLMKKVPTKKAYPYGDFKGIGDYTVKQRNFFKDANEKDIGKLYINKTQYFNKVPTGVYNFYIGGYQVLDKYLKDRRNRKLNLSEVENIEMVIRIIQFTIDKMQEIDKLTKNWI